MLPVWLTDTLTSDLDRALHYALLWGLQGVELRTVGSAAERVPHVNEAKLTHRLKESEMLPAAIAPGLFEQPVARRAVWLNELATFGETLRFCERLGCPRLTVSAFASSEEGEEDDEAAAQVLQRAGEMAARFGRTLAVQNAFGMARPTGAALARLLAAVDHEAVQAAWNPADALRAGEDPAAGLDALAGRVALVRCYDGAPAPGGGWMHAPFGEGEVNWPGQLRALRAQGFAGPLSLELHVEPRPQQGLRDATQLIRWIREVR